MSWLQDELEKIIIPDVFQWLTGLQAENFNSIVEWVLEAEAKFNSGTDKAEWVKKQIADILKVALPWVLNVSVELAVAYAKKQGLIPNK